MTGVSFLAEARFLSLPPHLYSGIHPAFYPLGAEGSLSRSKVAEIWR